MGTWHTPWPWSVARSVISSLSSSAPHHCTIIIDTTEPHWQCMITICMLRSITTQEDCLHPLHTYHWFQGFMDLNTRLDWLVTIRPKLICTSIRWKLFRCLPEMYFFTFVITFSLTKFIFEGNIWDYSKLIF